MHGNLEKKLIDPMMGSPDSPNEQGFVDMHYYALKKNKDDKTNYRTLICSVW